MRKLGIMLFIMLFAFTAAYAQTTSNNNDIDVVDVTGACAYTFTWELENESSGDIYYSQAMLLAPFSENYGYMYFACEEAGTEDVNVFFEYSNDLSTWHAGTTDSDLDAVGTTAVYDTLGIVQGSDENLYDTSIFFRVKAVNGQAIDAGEFYGEIMFKKPAGLEVVKLGNATDY